MPITELENEIQQAETAAISSISSASDAAALEHVKPDILGKKSPIRQFLRRLGELSAEERPEAGKVINLAQERVENAFEERLAALRDSELRQKLETERIDVTLPSGGSQLGSLHPLTLTLREMERIFVSMGYEIATGPEIETEYNNFDALNIAPDHPARDMHDTFYLWNGNILRTHTSPVQIRYMQNHAPPLAIIAPGRVYRVDDIDATHSPVFHQLEGLLVDREVSMAHLKGTFDEFFHALFGKDLKTRFRPSYFPFTEPSAEVDMQCFVCGGKSTNCRTCKQSGWIEMGGAGLVHPKVLENVGINPAQYSGFAFGLGVERLTMLRYNVPTMRLLYENDLRFLRQFPA
jgi:phenylalanyl-tRNA synthetase alpha chain